MSKDLLKAIKLIEQEKGIAEDILEIGRAHV